jgi:hypothetical protein
MPERIPASALWSWFSVSIFIVIRASRDGAGLISVALGTISDAVGIGIGAVCVNEQQKG